MDAERVKAFLEELTELTQRHRISIGGCGCCSSPALDEQTGNKMMMMRHYVCDEHGGQLEFACVRCDGTRRPRPDVALVGEDVCSWCRSPCLRCDASGRLQPGALVDDVVIGFETECPSCQGRGYFG